MKTQAECFGCNTYSYIRSEPAHRCLARLADFGFRKFELMVHPGHLWPLGPNADNLVDLLRTLSARGLEVVTLNMPNIDINVAAAVPEMRAYSIAMLTGTIRLAGEIGVRGIVIGPGKANPLFPADAAELTPHFFAALDALCPLAKSAGTALWVENMPFAYLPAIDELMSALDHYGNDDVGIVYDVANAHFINEDIRAGLVRCGKRLRLVHLSDTGRQQYRHDPVGHGSVPFREIPAMLCGVGYHESPMLEIISRNADSDILDSVEKLTAFGFAPALAVSSF
ncbi:MAG TPA: sugar phosphate isomerase/epimerase family protein [Pseudolabrys sp.]